MAQIDELIRRIEVMEKEGSAAAVARLETRVRSVEDKLEGHSTALGKIITLLEETRTRVSAVEIEVSGLRDDVRAVKADIAGLRRDLPSMLVEAIRDAKP